MDQVGFRRGTGIDHALAVFETVCGKSIEWNSEIWFASLDLTKAFDRVEHSQLFQALREQHVPQPYIAYMLLARIEPLIEAGQPEEQHGFRPNRGLEESSRVEPACPKAAPLGRRETTNLN